jgi:hypothetical protein
MATGWERLASGTYSTHTIDSGVFAAKKYLKITVQLNLDPLVAIMAFGHSSGGTMVTSEGSYATRRNINGGSEGAFTDNPFDWGGYLGHGGSDSDGGAVLEMDIINVANKEKKFIGHFVYGDAGAGTAPSRSEIIGQWTDTSNQIRRIQLWTGNNSNSWSAGTTITVWGAESVGTPVYPNLPNGTIFEQTNDYKYYMFDGTSAWTVVATT